MDGLRTEERGQQKQSNDPGNNQHNPQYANYWAPLTRKRHIPPHSAQLRHTNHWALRMRKRHQQEHRPQRPTERSDPMQHAKGRTGDCPGPRKGATTRRNVTRGGGGVPNSRALDGGVHLGGGAEGLDAALIPRGRGCSPCGPSPPRTQCIGPFPPQNIVHRAVGGSGLALPVCHSERRPLTCHMCLAGQSHAHASAKRRGALVQQGCP